MDIKEIREQIDFAIGKLVPASLFNEEVKSAVEILMDVNTTLEDCIE